MKILLSIVTKLSNCDYCRQSVYKLQRIQIKHFSNNDNQIAVIGIAGAERAKLISKAMKIYLEKAKNYDTFIENEIKEFEIGKRHLANIMGVNVDNFTQEDIDKAIEYLLPSGLFDKKARPKLKHPLQILPKKKVAQFGNDGRPYSSFFYTIKSSYSQCLHNLSTKLEYLNEHEDKQLLHNIAYDENLKLKLTGSKWLEMAQVNSFLEEQLTESEYKSLLIYLERLSSHPYSYLEKDFIFQFRNLLQVQNLITMETDNFEIKVDDKNREYFEATGYRKTTEATVKLFPKGSGIFTVNETSFLRFFPKLIDREQVLNPLNITGRLRSVDVEGVVEGEGESCRSGAVRHALACALQAICSPQEVQKLRLAGLLQRDLRRRERKKPGQKGARAKFTWKKR